MDSLLSAYEDRIYRFSLRLCGNEADARDVLQETLLAAFKNVATFRGDAKLSTWLYQVARSFCIKQRRRHEGQPRSMERLDGPDAMHEPAPESALDSRAHAKQVSEVIEAGLNALPEEQREALVLRDVEGLSAEEAAEVAGVEVSALKSRLHRARVALKRSLSAVLDEHPTEALGCPALALELSAYAETDIDHLACERIEAHLVHCAHCSAACDELKQTVLMCRSMAGSEVPASVKAAVRHALRANSSAP